MKVENIFRMFLFCWKLYLISRFMLRSVTRTHIIESAAIWRHTDVSSIFWLMNGFKEISIYIYLYIYIHIYISIICLQNETRTLEPGFNQCFSGTYRVKNWFYLVINRESFMMNSIRSNRTFFLFTTFTFSVSLPSSSDGCGSPSTVFTETHISFLFLLLCNASQMGTL